MPLAPPKEKRRRTVPEIGVGFKLFADATALERGVVRAKKGIKDLDNETKVIKKTFAVVAAAAAPVVLAFSAMIGSAQTLRDEAVKNGKAIDSSTDALARYGDTWDSIKSSVADFGRGILGGIVKFGEALGEAVGNGVSLGEAYRRNNALRESEIGLAQTLKRIDEGRAAFFKSANEDLEKQAKVRERLIKLIQEAGDLENKNWMENLSSAQKMRFFEDLRSTSQGLLKDPNASAEQQAGARIAIQNAQTEINRLVKEGVESANEVTELRKQEKREQRELAKDRKTAVAQVATDQNALKDRSKLSLAELAAISPFAAGVDSRLSEAGVKAREAFDLEQQAEGRRLAGDVAASDALRGRAGEIRKGLVDSGVLKSTDNDPAIALKEALKTSEDALVSIDKKIAGTAE